MDKLPAHRAYGIPITVTANSYGTQRGVVQTEYTDTVPEAERTIEAIYRAVLARVVLDLKSTSKNYEDVKAKADAKAWIGSRDFDDVCLMAGFTPEGVLRKLELAKGNDYQRRAKVRVQND